MQNLNTSPRDSDLDMKHFNQVQKPPKSHPQITVQEPLHQKIPKPCCQPQISQIQSINFLSKQLFLKKKRTENPSWFNNLTFPIPCLSLSLTFPNGVVGKNNSPPIEKHRKSKVDFLIIYYF